MNSHRIQYGYIICGIVTFDLVFQSRDGEVIVVSMYTH